VAQYENCFSIGTLSKKAGLPVSTINYYLKMGLISPVFTHNTYRYFNHATLEIIKRIQFLSRERLTLSEIKEKIDRERGKSA
jgi:MerR family transcriptional regulator, copper efflux regulator